MSDRCLGLRGRYGRQANLSGVAPWGRRLGIVERVRVGGWLRRGIKRLNESAGGYSCIFSGLHHSLSLLPNSFKPGPASSSSRQLESLRCIKRQPKRLKPSPSLPMEYFNSSKSPRPWRDPQQPNLRSCRCPPRWFHLWSWSMFETTTIDSVVLLSLCGVSIPRSSWHPVRSPAWKEVRISHAEDSTSFSHGLCVVTVVKIPRAVSSFYIYIWPGPT